VEPQFSVRSIIRSHIGSIICYRKYPYSHVVQPAVPIPDNKIGKVDLHMEGNINVALDNNKNVKRMSTAIMTAIRIVTHLLDDSEQIPRQDIISIKKFIAEGTSSKAKQF